MAPNRDVDGREQLRVQAALLKRIADPTTLERACLPTPGGLGQLMPVCDLHRDDAKLIARLAAWREAAQEAFPSRFTVTRAGTAHWLHRSILENDDRILFLVRDRTGTAIGQVGLAGLTANGEEVEAENIVRGVTQAAPGLMSDAMRALLDWCHVHGVPRIILRVFNDNTHAIRFYEQLGFTPAGLQPLRRYREADAIVYQPVLPGDTAPPDKRFLRMVHEC
jgi:perosamine synthetase